ncbi:Hypothetical predicted protein [Pelobates cultripes]|uniref:Uncharacterized protein n=1 Tax=Pelobates cultripes TaxID=61616 RepID=A0AAD1R232_PELCU|nr:Hypothetical predicted protein [Pelobates cultripes]
MDISHLLGFVKKTFCRISSICSISWITSALTSSKDTPTKKNIMCISCSEQPPNAEIEVLREELTRIQKISTSLLQRIQNVETQMGKIETDLIEEKALWRAKYQELTEEHEVVKAQHNRCINMEQTQRMDPYVAASDWDLEPLGDETNGLNRCSGALVMAAPYNSEDLTNSAECYSVEGPCTLYRCLSLSSVVSHANSGSSGPSGL